jgi:hypothetical protein
MNSTRDNSTLILSLDLSPMPCNTTLVLVAELQLYELQPDEICHHPQVLSHRHHDTYSRKTIQLTGSPEAKSKKNFTFHRIIEGCYTFTLFPSFNGIDGDKNFNRNQSVGIKNDVRREMFKHGTLQKNRDGKRAKYINIIFLGSHTCI